MKHEFNENREIELKLALPSFTDYLKLIGYIGNADAKSCQTNIFYDTPDKQISKLGYALRLRIEPTGGIVTLKSTTSQVSEVAVRKEIEEFITIEDAIEIQQAHNFLSLDIPAIRLLHSESVDLIKLQPILQFENARLKKEIQLNNRYYIFEIDKTTYADGSVVYELEIELDKIDEIENAVTDVQKLFKSLDIEFIVMKKSKFERALEVAGLI